MYLFLFEKSANLKHPNAHTSCGGLRCMLASNGDTEFDDAISAYMMDLPVQSQYQVKERFTLW